MNVRVEEDVSMYRNGRFSDFLMTVPAGTVVDVTIPAKEMAPGYVHVTVAGVLSGWIASGVLEPGEWQTAESEADV